MKDHELRIMPKRELDNLIDSVQIIKMKYPMSSLILPFPFCPRCGCSKTFYHDHLIEYPEVWVEVFCKRCNFLVGTADNSPYYHCLEFKKENFIIS